MDDWSMAYIVMTKKLTKEVATLGPAWKPKDAEVFSGVWPQSQDLCLKKKG